MAFFANYVPISHKAFRVRLQETLHVPEHMASLAVMSICYDCRPGYHLFDTCTFMSRLVWPSLSATYPLRTRPLGFTVFGRLRSLTHAFDPIQTNLDNREREPSVKEYPSWLSLYNPLVYYFSILQIQLSSSGNLPAIPQVILACNGYLRLLYDLYLEYDWTALLNYHFSFMQNV
jgi:hypothetical protein